MREIFIPEIKIKTDHTNRTNKVCPISGWRTNNKTTVIVIKNEREYLRYILEYFSLLKIILIKIIKNGLTNSIGWNLGRKYRSIHLLDPLTSIPIIGTKDKKIIEIRKMIKEILINFCWLIEEKIKINPIPKIVKIRCLKKNK